MTNTNKPFEHFDNFNETHSAEEKLRAESMAIIQTDPALHKRMVLVESAISLIFVYTHDHTAENDDQVTLKMLGIRLFNAACSAVKLGLSGYYQNAFALIRDIMETGFLIDLFRTSPEKVAIWKTADDKIMYKEFK